MLPIYPGLTAIVQANSSLIPRITPLAPAPAPVASPILDSPLSEALLHSLPNFGAAGSVITGVPPSVNTTELLASSNSTLYTEQGRALPANETYIVRMIQPAILELFPGLHVDGVFGSILGTAP